MKAQTKLLQKLQEQQQKAAAEKKDKRKHAAEARLPSNKRLKVERVKQDDKEGKGKEEKKHSATEMKEREIKKHLAQNVADAPSLKKKQNVADDPSLKKKGSKAESVEASHGKQKQKKDQKQNEDVGSSLKRKLGAPDAKDESKKKKKAATQN
jgi:hypothetical protein